MNVSKANNPDAFILPVSELKESQPVFRQSVKQQATPLNMKDEAFPVPRYNDESIEYQQQLKSLKNSKTPLVGKASVFINESMSIEPQTQRLSSMNLAKTNQRLNHFIKKLKPMPILEEKPIQPNFQTQFIAKIPKSVNQNDEYVIPQIPVENQDSSRSFIRSKPRIFEKQEIYQQPQPLPSIEIPNSTELEALAQELQENYDVGRLYLNYFGKKGLQQSQEEIRYFYCNGCEEFIDQRRQETHECKNKNIIIEAQLRKVDEKLKKITILIENNTKAKSNPDFRRFAYIGIAIIQKARSEVDPNNLSKFVDDLMKVRNSLEQIEPDNPTNQMIHEAMESTRIKLLALL